MSTILTDDERPELPSPVYGPDTQVDEDSDGAYTVEQMEAYADAREAAVLAKLARQEPVAFGMPDTQLGRKHRLMMVRLDKGQDGCTLPLYTHPAPQQADRQRVPEGWKLVPIEPTPEMVDAYVDHPAQFRSTCSGWFAMLAAAPEAPAQNGHLADDERVAALCTLSYAAGMKAGWNYCASEDNEGFERSQKSVGEAIRILKAHRAAPEAPAQEKSNG